MFKLSNFFIASAASCSCYNKSFIQKTDKTAVFPGSQNIFPFGIGLKIAVLKAFFNFFPADFNPLFDIIDNLRTHFINYWRQMSNKLGDRRLEQIY